MQPVWFARSNGLLLRTHGELPAEKQGSAFNRALCKGLSAEHRAHLYARGFMAEINSVLEDKSLVSAIKVKDRKLL